LPEPLEIVLSLATIPDALLTHPQVEHWPEGLVEAFESMKLLQRASDATHVVCGECSDRHTAEVIERTLPKGKTGHAIYCPDAGLVAVESDCLRQWRVSLPELVKLTARAFGIDDKPEELSPDEVWRLGSTTVGDHLLAVVLARESADLTKVVGVSPGRTLLLALGTPHVPESIRFAGVAPLASTVRYRGNKLVINRERLQTAIVQVEYGGERPVVDEQSLTISFRDKSCRFTSRSRGLFKLFACLNQNPGQHVWFDRLRDSGEVFDEYEVEDSSIRTAMTRLRAYLKKRGIPKLARCLKTGTVDGAMFAELDLSAINTKSH
jgi:hypothetical protein